MQHRKQLMYTAAVALSAVLALTARPAAAALFVVNTEVDAVDAVIDGVCSTAGGDCSLRAAVQEANASLGDDEIELPAGSYVLTVAGRGEDLAASGDLDVVEASGLLEIVGDGADVTDIDGGEIDRVFDVRSMGALSLEGVTIRGGHANTQEGFMGGGLQILSTGSVTLRDCVVEDNLANLGGGILNGGALVMERCLVANNMAVDLGFTNPWAGGMASGSTSASRPDATAWIEDSTIAFNTADGDPGGLELGNSDVATLHNVTVSDNSGQELTIADTDVTLVNVTVAGDDDGALRLFSFDESHTLSLSNTLIAGTSACTGGSRPMISSLGGNASSDATCGFSDTGDLENADLTLGPLGDNGGSTPTRLPARNSAAVDGGENSGCLPADQRAEPRPTDGDGDETATCDIGAVELPEPGTALLWAAALTTLAASHCRSRARSRIRRDG